MNSQSRFAITATVVLAVALLAAGCAGRGGLSGKGVAEMELFTMQDDVLTRWASPENPGVVKGGAGMLNQGGKGRPYVVVGPDESIVLLDYEGSGIIRRIWMTVEHATPKALRELRLDMFWDGADTPAVTAPLGDFFAATFGIMTPFENALFMNPEARSFNTYIPMPFRTGARIVITNETREERPDSTHRIFYDVDFSVRDGLPDDALYFHAYWHRQRPTQLGEDFEILPRVQGRGRFLGCHIGVLGVPGNIGWWGEGETKIFLDGDTDWPTLSGTGTEDYIGTGWGQGVYIGRYQGAFIADYEADRHAFYRYHVPDPVYFHQDCRVTIQQMGGARILDIVRMREMGVAVTPTAVYDDARDLKHLLGKDKDRSLDSFDPHTFVSYYRQDDVCAVAYFYLDRPENNLPALAQTGHRTARRWNQPVPDKTVVLTFDDAVNSHLHYVAPLLRDLGFGATFFVTNQWRDNDAFLSWPQIGELHQLGFEIGNHTWTHGAFSTPEQAATLPDELKQVEAALAEVGVPKPVSFAWCGNAFGPEAREVLRANGYRYARRGMQPERPYGEMKIGPAYAPDVHDPLLIPTTGDAYPDWDLEHFKRVVAEARDGRIAVLQFHGVPDPKHPWVSTPPDRFRAYMEYLKAEGFTVIAMRDIAPWINPDIARDDPMAQRRYPLP